MMELVGLVLLSHKDLDMKKSKVFKFIALAGAGAYAYSFLKENPHLFGLEPTNREKANQIIDRMQTYNIMNSDVAGLARDVIDFSGKRHDSTVIDVSARRSE